eukprot:scaffold21193_cov62-Phaeocystis_antarctica.AAC.2
MFGSIRPLRIPEIMECTLWMSWSFDAKAIAVNDCPNSSVGHNSSKSPVVTNETSWLSTSRMRCWS